MCLLFIYSDTYSVNNFAANLNPISNACRSTKEAYFSLYSIYSLNIFKSLSFNDANNFSCCKAMDSIRFFSSLLISLFSLGRRFPYHRS